MPGCSGICSTATAPSSGCGAWPTSSPASTRNGGSRIGRCGGRWSIRPRCCWSSRPGPTGSLTLPEPVAWTGTFGRPGARRRRLAGRRGLLRRWLRAPRPLRSGAVRDALDTRRPRAGVPRCARSVRRRAGAGVDARADRRARQRRGDAAARPAAAPGPPRGCAGDAPAAGVAGVDRTAGARRQLRRGGSPAGCWRALVDRVEADGAARGVPGLAQRLAGAGLRTARPVGHAGREARRGAGRSAAGRPVRVEWEGQRYVVDRAAATRARIERVQEAQGRPVDRRRLRRCGGACRRDGRLDLRVRAAGHRSRAARQPVRGAPRFRADARRGCPGSPRLAARRAGRGRAVAPVRQPPRPRRRAGGPVAAPGQRRSAVADAARRGSRRLRADGGAAAGAGADRRVARHSCSDSSMPAGAASPRCRARTTRARWPRPSGSARGVARRSPGPSPTMRPASRARCR